MLQLGRTVPCSWLKIRLGRGHRSCAGHSWPSQAPCSGGLFKSVCPLLSSDTFPGPLSLHNSHICLWETARHRDGLTKQPGPYFLSLAPAPQPLIPCCQRIPQLFFFFDISHPLRPCMICFILKHCGSHHLWHRHAIPPASPCIWHGLGL